MREGNAISGYVGATATAQPGIRVNAKDANDDSSELVEGARSPSTKSGRRSGRALTPMGLALDHMAWAFARTVHDPPSRRTQFPMFESRPNDIASDWRVRQIPKPMRDIMEAMQPYQTEDQIGQIIGRELAVLRELSNRDKHRVLLLAQSVVLPKLVSSNTPQGGDSGVTFDLDPDAQWAEISHPLDPRYGPYDPQFEAEVTIIEPDLPWRSGLDGIARALVEETDMATGAFRGQWPLLVPADPKIERG